MLRRDFLRSLPSLAFAGYSSTLISHACAQNTRSPDDYVFGSTGALTGPLGSFGLNMKGGVDAAFAHANANGGVHGRKLHFDMADDGYVPSRSVENISKLLADKEVLGLIGCLGTANNAAITPLIEKTAMAHLAPLTGASSLRRADTQNLFHVRASYTDETRRLVQNLVSMGITKLTVVYLDNPYGKEVLGDVSRALEAAGIKSIAQVALATDGKNIDAVVASVLDSKPSAVLLGTAGAATTGVVAALRQSSPTMPIACISAALTQDGIRKLGTSAQGIAVTMVFPNGEVAKLPFVRDYHAAAKAIGQTTFSSGGLEGYVSGRLMIEALNRAGRGAGRDKVRTALAGIRNFDLGGYPIDFANKPFVGSKFVDLGVLSSDGKLRA